MTTATQAAAETLVNDAVVLDRILYLKARWADEREHEDFADYQSVLASDLPVGIALLKLSRSFEATVLLPGNVKAVLFLKRSGRQRWLALRPAAA